MSGRPVPRGLRGVNPPRDRILCRRRRGRVGHGPTASSPANAFFLVRGSHGRIIHEDLGSEWIFCRASAVALRRRPLGRGATRRVSAVAICRLKPSPPNAHSPLVAARSASRKAASRGGPNSARYARRSAAERPSSRSSEWSVTRGSAAANAPAP
jgi:hypothetical protein